MINIGDLTPEQRLALARGEPVPPAGDVEVLGWALNDGDEHPIDITLQWGVAKHWPEYATPLVDRAHVTRLTAERDEIRAIKDSAIESVALLHAERVGLLAEVERLKGLAADRWRGLIDMRDERDALQSELTKARELVGRMNCADRLDHLQAIQDLYQWAQQPAPAAKGDVYPGHGILQGIVDLKDMNP